LRTRKTVPIRGPDVPVHGAVDERDCRADSRTKESKQALARLWRVGPKAKNPTSTHSGGRVRKKLYHRQTSTES